MTQDEAIYLTGSKRLGRALYSIIELIPYELSNGKVENPLHAMNGIEKI